jgi:sigma-B regulation protein RsbU (phosphoserine phosphatase)
LAIRGWLKEHDQLVSIQHDLNVSRKIQQAILPKIFPPFPDQLNFDIYASMVAAKEVGGDFYDFFLIDEHRLGIVIGDVSGKGVSAAIFMAVSRTLIRATGLKGDTVSECMRYANNLLCKESVSCMFVTVFYGILNTQTGVIDYVNAGHNPPFILSANGIRKVEMTNGLALGVLDDFKFQSKKIQMEKGDQLLLYTDGVVEAINLKELAYSEERFKNLLNQRLNQPVESIIKETFTDVNDFVAGAPQFDDITLLGLTYNGNESAI